LQGGERSGYKPARLPVRNAPDNEAVAGFAPGWLLGQLVRRGRVAFFVKHRWMLALVGTRRHQLVYGHVLLNSTFDAGDKKGDSAVTIEGILSDTYFAADGTLLYLVFSSYTEAHVSLATPPYLGIKKTQWPPDGKNDNPEQLVIEGKSIAMAEYQRLPVEKVAEKSGLDRLEQAVDEDDREEAQLT
jgi:hypothetical protein